MSDTGMMSTDVEKERHSLGRRRINLIWELTQAVIAVAVTGTTLYVSGVLAVKDNGDVRTFSLIGNAFFLIIGFYFGRTNHSRLGRDGDREV